MTREETRKLLQILYNSYPNNKIKSAAEAKTMLDVWEMTFAEYSADQVYKAARLHIKTSKFFPTPADIVGKVYKAGIIYSEENTMPKIETPKIEAQSKKIIYDDDFYDNLLDLEPSECCYSCSRYEKCFKTN